MEPVKGGTGVDLTGAIGEITSRYAGSRAMLKLGSRQKQQHMQQDDVDDSGV